MTIRVHKSRSHEKGWSQRGIRERLYEGWFKAQKETPTPEAIFAKRLELGFTKEVRMAKKPSYRIHQNVWDNWYGYEGTRRVEQFFNTPFASAEDNAKAWLKAKQEGK